MSELNRLKVVDFTMGRSDSEDVNTDVPFADNFEKTRTIQQANVVLGAYVNRNYKDMQNKADIDDIPTKLSELDNDVGYITDGDIPTKTSDLVNDGADTEHPFITNQVDDLVNYTDTETLNTDLGDINDDIGDINNNLQGINDALDLQLPNRIGDIVVDSIRSKNMFNLGSVLGNTAVSSGVLINDNNNDIFVIRVEVGKTYTISKTSYNGGVLGFYSSFPKIGDTLTDRQSMANQTTITITAPSNYLCMMIAHADDKSTIQVEKGSTRTPYRKYQQLDDFEFENVSITRNTTYITNQGYTRVITYGKICIGYFNVRLTGSIADNTILISGLPQCYFERFGFSASGSNNQGFRFYIDNTGNIHSDGAITFEGWVAGNFIFPIK